MINFKSVNKEYQSGTVVFENLNMDITKGEFVFLVGASGSGKLLLCLFLLLYIRASAFLQI